MIKEIQGMILLGLLCACATDPIVVKRDLGTTEPLSTVKDNLAQDQLNDPVNQEEQPLTEVKSTEPHPKLSEKSEADVIHKSETYFIKQALPNPDLSKIIYEYSTHQELEFNSPKGFGAKRDIHSNRFLYDVASDTHLKLDLDVLPRSFVWMDSDTIIGIKDGNQLVEWNTRTQESNVVLVSKGIYSLEKNKANNSLLSFGSFTTDTSSGLGLQEYRFENRALTSKIQFSNEQRINSVKEINHHQLLISIISENTSDAANFSLLLSPMAPKRYESYFVYDTVSATLEPLQQAQNLDELAGVVFSPDGTHFLIMNANQVQAFSRDGTEVMRILQPDQNFLLRALWKDEQHVLLIESNRSTPGLAATKVSEYGIPSGDLLSEDRLSIRCDYDSFSLQKRLLLECPKVETLKDNGATKLTPQIYQFNTSETSAALELLDLPEGSNQILGKHHFSSSSIGQWGEPSLIFIDQPQGQGRSSVYRVNEDGQTQQILDLPYPETPAFKFETAPEPWHSGYTWTPVYPESK